MSLGFVLILARRREIRGAFSCFSLVLRAFLQVFLKSFKPRKACIQSALDCNGAKCLHKIC